MDKVESINLIYRSPDVRGGMPCIVGTGLRVLDIVMAMQFGHRAPAQIANDYQVSLGKAHAALAYYYENKDEIDHDVREDLRIARELIAEHYVPNAKSALLQAAFEMSRRDYYGMPRRAAEEVVADVGDELVERLQERVRREYADSSSINLAHTAAGADRIVPCGP